MTAVSSFLVSVDNFSSLSNIILSHVMKWFTVNKMAQQLERMSIIQLLRVVLPIVH